MYSYIKLITGLVKAYSDPCPESACAGLGIRSACTHCEPSLLSYRRDPGDSRRIYNFIGFS